FPQRAHLRELHSFPTRRSSDLQAGISPLTFQQQLIVQAGLGGLPEFFNGRGLLAVAVGHELLAALEVVYVSLYADRCKTRGNPQDRKSTRLNSSHVKISYAVFC